MPADRGANCSRRAFFASPSQAARLALGLPCLSRLLLGLPARCLGFHACRAANSQRAPPASRSGSSRRRVSVPRKFESSLGSSSLRLWPPTIVRRRELVPSWDPCCCLFQLIFGLSPPPNRVPGVSSACPTTSPNPASSLLPRVSVTRPCASLDPIEPPTNAHLLIVPAA